MDPRTTSVGSRTMSAVPRIAEAPSRRATSRSTAARARLAESWRMVVRSMCASPANGLSSKPSTETSLRDTDSSTDQHIDHAQCAAVVECEDRGGQGLRLEHRGRRCGALTFGQPTRTGQFGQRSRVRCASVAAVTLGRPRCPTTVEIQNPPVSQPDEVVHAKRCAHDVVAAHGIHATDPPRHHHEGRVAASSVSSTGRQLRTDQQESRRTGRRRACAAHGARRGAG